MADNIVGGLFGMTPESLQAQRNAQLEQQASNFVNNYGDQNAMFGYKLGATLGRGIGGMLGAQDPEMMRIQQRQQMLQGLDMNDPDSLLRAAQAANQAGDTSAAQELYNKAQQVAKARADIAKTEAETQKALRERAGADPLEQLLRTGKYTPASVQAYAASGNPADLVAIESSKVNYGDSAEIESRALFGIPFSKLTQAQSKQVADSLEAKGVKRAAAGAPKVSPEINLTAKELDWRKQYLDENKPIIEQASNVRQSLNLLSQGSPFATAAFKNTVVSAFGGDKQKSKSEIDRLVNTGALDTRIANSVLSFFEGTISPTTVEDQRNVLTAVDKVLQARYENKAKDWTTRLTKANVNPTMVVPSYEETVGTAPQSTGAATIVSTNPDGTLTVRDGQGNLLTVRKKGQ